ncbi:MAG: hybrid sensor histidine kinase/response regulator [Verrucomicrobiales bacterium]|nr:hybrid sensor histidine kinase/response regulator [Verrucomicrobiales bacterium]
MNADTTRLEQVFSNLLGNACKYSGEGSHIRLSAARTSGVEPSEVVICVRDDGAGIAPELLPRLFDLFVQGSRSSDREHGGLGIGLTLVRRLVKLHGGSVEAHSRGEGCGSEFMVRLPVLEKAPPPSPPPAPSSARHVKDTPRRILIVEDNRDAALSLARLQSHRGHTTHVAFSGPEAIATAGEFLPGVVLLDIGLPGMDGFEVARRLRAMPELSGVFLVALSGYDSAEDRSRAQAAGFDQYMVKPANLTLLREWLQNRPE